MTLETLYFLAQIVAALAIVASLLFVGLQLRAQNREQQLARGNDAAESHDRFQKILIENPDLRDIWVKGADSMDALAPAERIAFGAFLALWVGAMMRFEQRTKAGYASPASRAETLAMYRSVTRREGARQWWRRARGQYPPTVQSLGDELFGLTEEASPSEPGSSSTQ